MPNETFPQQSPKEEDKKVSANLVVLLKGEVKIYPGRRLPDFDKREVKAYEAETKTGARAFAMVCQENLVPRNDLAYKYLKAESPILPKLSASGVVDWDPDGKERYAFVFENILGQPLISRSPKPFLGLKADLVLTSIFPRLYEAVSSLHDRGVTHGNICIQNLFDGGSQALDNVMLGECLSTPCGYSQPALFETSERALALPAARGNASYADDIYALGMCLACLIASHDFTEGMTGEEIALYKLEHSSVSLVTSRDRFPGHVVEMLRGMLDDDPEMRWSLWEINESLEGRRVTPKQKTRGIPKASRPIDFLNKNYFRPDILASQLHKDPNTVSRMVEGGDFYLWLNRSLQNKPYEERYEASLEQAKKNDSLNNAADRMTSYVSSALAPSLPVFYRGVSFFPSGFGALLADAMVTRKDPSVFVEVMQGDIASSWAKHRLGAGLPVGDEVSQFETCRMYLLQKHIGFGLERCVYFLAPSLHCLSDKLVGYQARSSADLLLSLEKVAQNKNRPSWFMDRHISAFIFAHDRPVIEAYTADLNALEKYRQVSGVLKTFAIIQARDQLGALPALASWICEHLGDLVNRYHDRERRRLVQREIDRLRAKGDLQLIANLFNNFQELQTDMKQFTQAMRQFQQLRTEYNSLSIELETNKKFGISTGHQVSTMVAGAIAAFVVVIYVIFLSLG